MRSLAVRVVILLAFAAHAVLGCCGHHGHAISRHGCGAAGNTLAVIAHTPSDHCSHVGCCIGEHRTGKPAQVEHAQAEPVGGDQAVILADGDGQASESPVPCRDSHSCGGSVCTYVLAEAQSLLCPAAEAGRVFGLTAIDAVQIQAARLCQAPTPAHRSSSGRSSAALRALFQSWQV